MRPDPAWQFGCRSGSQGQQAGPAGGAAQREDPGGRSGDWRPGQGQPWRRQEAGASGGVQGTGRVALAGEAPAIPEAGEAGMGGHTLSLETPPP